MSERVEASEVPRAEVERGGARRPSAAWVAPVLALVVVGVLGYQSWRERGEVITVRFADASGLEEGDPVLYRGIDVGMVREVRLDEDLSRVAVEIELRRDATRLAREGARFWIVRPEVTLQRVSGLETLLGPRYVSVLPGEGEGRLVREHEGLEGPPPVREVKSEALELVIRASRRGSLSAGSPVLYRDVAVGEVNGTRLSEDARWVEVQVVIEPRYAGLVRENSRFWNAGGFGVDWGLLGGLSVKAESIESVLLGGIGFATPDRPGKRVESGHVFELAEAAKEDWLGWDPEIGLDE